MIEKNHLSGNCRVWLIMVLIMIGCVNYFTNTTPPSTIYISLSKSVLGNIKFASPEDKLLFLGQEECNNVWVQNAQGERYTFNIGNNDTIDYCPPYPEGFWLKYQMKKDHGFYFTTKKHIEDTFLHTIVR